MKSSIEMFLDILKDNRNGKGTGIYSVCSAHPVVLEASMIQAKADDSIILIESTSNQVDQFGGYTGMKPLDFVKYVHKIAVKIKFPVEKILLGGDHLGPNPWKNLTAKDAMENAKVLVYEYVKAGFQKIHLDASMFCKDDAGDKTKPLDDNIVSERAAVLCEAAEKAWKEHRKDHSKPVYIIGTEVPIPGGAQEKEDSLSVTKPDDVKKTIETAKKAFEKHGLTDAWTRVYGVVVQPGVEFGDDQIFDYESKKATELSKYIEEFNNFIYEAHSTDYQTEKNLKSLVQDHFCILKVGPWVTFALREGLFALEMIEQELLSMRGSPLSNLRSTLERIMLENPDNWKKYYHGDVVEQSFKRKYSLSDRIRYYWNNDELNKSIARLMKNLTDNKIPLSILNDFMPNQYLAVREKEISINPNDLLIHKVREVLSLYARACNMSKKGEKLC